MEGAVLGAASFDRGQSSMSEPFLSEIRMLAFNFAPRGWSLCDGQLMPINQNQALFALLGTTFGGDGVQTFGLPDMRSRTPVHSGQGPGLSNYVLGQRGGEENHFLSTTEMPAHVHQPGASTSAPTTGSAGTGMALATPTASKPYRVGSSNLVPLSPVTVGSTGGNQPHPNMQPYLTVSFAIALQGIFPSRN
jgi:microcystin-dependent protein